MKFISVSLLVLLVCIKSSFAQVEAESIPDNNSMSQSNDLSGNSLYGKIVDKLTGKPIEAASIQLYPTSAKKTGSIINGMLSRPNGEFSFQNLANSDSIVVLVTALGYKKFEEVIRLNAGENKRGLFQKDLGNIAIASEIKQLETVTVNAVRPALVMGIDRKVFNVDKSLLSTGGTAIDIMKNIPSVSVDIDGNIELRNSTPQIFIDGRPTILTLDQIPADNIDKIELITNPSAKFDASSSGGIINVVLKKNKRIGLNGVVTLSGGTPDLFSSNANLNLRQGKFNFFVGAGHNQSGGMAKGQTLRQNKSNNEITDYFNQYSVNKRKRNFNSIFFGTDIFINNRNSITISQNISAGKFGNLETQNQEYLLKDRSLLRFGTRVSDDDYSFNRNSSRINYKHNFQEEGRELTADATYNYGSRKSYSEIVNEFYNPDGSIFKPTAEVWNRGESNEYQLNIQSDYVHPLNEKSKIESGIRSNYSDFTSEYNVYAKENGLDVKLPLSNNYTYNEWVNAAYVTYSYKKESYSYQLGLRTEQAIFKGELIDSAYKFGYEYPSGFNNIWDALFPSLFVTQKISETDEIQFNYSRRIRRPRFWQLNPFIDINDPANLRQGNPQLRPEYINSFELNYSKNYKKGNLLAVLYFRNNPRDITQYSDTITAVQYQQLNNAAIDPNAILNTYINASSTNRYGAEVTLQHKPSKNLEITPTFNLQYRTVNAKVNNINLSNKGFNWEGKLITNYKIENPKKKLVNNLSFQMIFDYESPMVIPQGRRIAELDVDFAIRKDFMKDKKATLTFAVNDVFNSRRWGTIYDTEQFYQNSYRRWRVRSFRLSFTYKFGDSKFSLNRNGNRGRGGEDQ